MSDAPVAPPNGQTAPQTAMPLFFHRVVGVNPAEHGAKRLDRSVGYAFAAGAASIPIGLSEFELASRHYPVVFTASAVPTPVALVGINEVGNLFLSPEGAWRVEHYVPAYVRAFPFVFVEDAARKTTFVGMEASAACIRDDAGLPLFEDGKPTTALNDAIAFCSACRENINAALTFARAMDTAGLLQEEEATVNFTAGGSTRIRGFKVIRPDRLDQVPDETFLDWRRRGWIGAIYAHLHSAANWARLIDLAATRVKPPEG